MSATRQTDVLAADFARLAKSLLVSVVPHDAPAAAEQQRAQPRVVNALQARAASPAASLGDATWGGEMANDGGIATDFIAALRPTSIFYGGIVPRARQLPFRSRAAVVASIDTMGEVTENGWVPVFTGAFLPILLQPRKTGGIVAVTDELSRSADAAAFATLRTELIAAARSAVDGAVLATLLDGVTPISAAGVSPLLTIESLLNVVVETGAERMIFACGGRMGVILATTGGDAGRMFPLMTPAGGEVCGLPCFVTDRLPPDRLVLIDCAGFAVNEGTVDVDRSTAATLKMITDPANAAGEMVSLFQNNLSALRVLAGFGLEQIRAGAVAAADLGPQ